MNAFCRMLSCVVATVVIVAQSATGNMDVLDPPSHQSTLDFNAVEPSDFWERFHHAYDERAGEVFADRLHPLKMMELSLKRPADTWEQVVERGDRAIQKAFLKSFEYSLRDAALGLPVMGWLEARADAFGDFLEDSVNSVEEESVSPLDISYRQSERSWWKSLSEKRALRFGLRPFRTAPYAFLGLRLKEAGRTLLLGNVRYYFQNFTDHRFELSLSIPMPGRIAFDLGTFYQFGQHEVERKLVAKLFKPLKHGGIAHLGVEVHRDPVVFAGITIPL